MSWGYKEYIPELHENAAKLRDIICLCFTFTNNFGKQYFEWVGLDLAEIMVVDLATADRVGLLTVPGFGAKTADAILAWQKTREVSYQSLVDKLAGIMTGDRLLRYVQLGQVALSTVEMEEVTQSGTWSAEQWTFLGEVEKTSLQATQELQLLKDSQAGIIKSS